MRIAVLDYPGHAFAIQLCRSLAKRGHTILLSYYKGFPGPKGPLERRPDDSPLLTILPVDLATPFQKLNFFMRRRQEISVGEKFSRIVEEFRPDVVASCTMPIDAQHLIVRSAKRVGAANVFWLQDIISLAMREILGRKMPGVGHGVAAFYRRKEARLFLESDAVVAISEDFFTALSDVRIEEARRHVLSNWAPLPELPLQPKDNEWSRAHGLADKTVILYSGTLGLKHNPELLARLAEKLKPDQSARVVVVSEGFGTDYLSEAKRRRSLDNLILLPFQHSAAMPMMLGTADVLTAFVEPEAGTFSVPSKLLSYFCAGRAVLAAINQDNAAARDIRRHELGIVVEPRNEEGYLTAAIQLLSDAPLRQEYGRSARQYAEKTFDIEKITSRFEAIFEAAIGHCEDRSKAMARQ